MRYTLFVAVVVALAGVALFGVDLRERQALSASAVPRVYTEVRADILATNSIPTAIVERPRFTPVEIKCLALNIYHEARGEPPEGQLAVAHVVLNRTSDTRFPNHVCDVVKDGGEKIRYRCQFSWWCDGRSDAATDRAAWRASRKTAWAVLSGRVTDPTSGALWYHANYVRPDWADTKNRVATIGSHIFYLN